MAKYTLEVQKNVSVQEVQDIFDNSWLQGKVIVKPEAPQQIVFPRAGDDVRAACKNHNVEYCVECYPVVLIASHRA